MSTTRNVKEHIITKLQNTCFETKVISGTILKVVEIEHDSPPIRWGLHVVSSCQSTLWKEGKKEPYCGEISETVPQTGDQGQQQQ